MKLYYEDKLKIIEMYKQGIGPKEIAVQYNVARSTIQDITKTYREHGLEGLKTKRRNRKYTPEFKLKIINRVINGDSMSSLGIEYQINKGVIYSWYRKYKDLGYNGLKQDLRGAHMKKKPKPTTPAKPITKEDEIKRLEEENKKLKMEIDLLKKLNALVQQRKERQNKKK